MTWTPVAPSAHADRSTTPDDPEDHFVVDDDATPGATRGTERPNRHH